MGEQLGGEFGEKYLDEYEGFKVGQQVTVLRNSDEIESNWHIEEIIDNQGIIEAKIRRDEPDFYLHQTKGTKAPYKIVPIKTLKDWQNLEK